MSHNDRRAGANKAVFVLGDESMEGGDTSDQADAGAANTAVAVANAAETRGPHVPRQGRLEAAGGQQDRVRACRRGDRRPGIQYEDTLDGGFQQMLESVICASKAPEEPVEDCGCCKECMERKVPAAATP